MKKIGIIVVACCLGVGLMVQPVAAAPSDEVIKANCQAVQSVLSQIEKTDAALRINRGRVYNEIMDLFYAMNARLASNKISAANLVTITSDFDSELTHFRSDYNTYDDELNELISMQCQEKPADFYNQLEEVRSLRDNLDQRTSRLDSLLDDYWAEFNDNVRGQINV